MSKLFKRMAAFALVLMTICSILPMSVYAKPSQHKEAHRVSENDKGHQKHKDSGIYFYSSINLALADANASTAGKNADCSKKNAVASLSVKKKAIVIQLLTDTIISETLYPMVDMTIDLNGKRIGYTCPAAIKTTVEAPVKLVIEGRKHGSIIENEGRFQGKIRALFIEVGSVVTVNGGTYSGVGDYPKGYSTLPQAILNWGTLYINDAHVIGTHAGLQNAGTLYINGGVYEGFGHGGIYFAVDNTVAYVSRATIKECGIPEGYVKTAGKNGAAFYVGGGSNMSVYLDRCNIIGTKKHFTIRGTGGEKNNSVYVSNCTVDLEANIVVRIDNDTHKLYIGKGCNFNAENTNRPGAVIATDLTYGFKIKGKK